ncbi:hypothetical protein AJ80_08171 [Polytolypa hystricis UAMH7299]|uniref:Uncharacterized protein n=1 Tax=Polytolypa hystricis (strain UAMH7299) TaxID=1447883 RepID=A0A2B7XCF0_POLH7|nr:hypothetical protein AJ80_08171 [Polytolypa hystricis UAMH7299]
MDMNELVRHQSLWADACTRNSATEGTKASGVSVAGRAVNFHAVTGEAATSVQHQSEFIRPGHECDETTAEDVPAPGTAV